eukprot:4170422-Karenia_brevis.AAC.1
MDELHHLDYLDGRPSPLGLPGWTTFATWITWMDDFHHLDYLDRRLSPLGLPGWTTFTTWITWVDNLSLPA